MTDEEIRNYGIDYLINCGFVDAYVKKIMLPADINDLYEDYRQETWLSILEVPTSKWVEIYENALSSKHDFEYHIRNYFSILIRNTVKSTSSNAYKKLKKASNTEFIKTSNDWAIIEYQTPDDDVDYACKTISNRLKNCGSEDDE